MVQKKDTAFLASAFAKVAKNKKYWNQWLVVDIWATLINEELQLPDELKVTGGYLSAWLMKSKKYMPIRDLVQVYHNPNCCGIFKSKIARIFLYDFKNISNFYQLDFLIPLIWPDLTNLKNTGREKFDNLLKVFLLIVLIHLFETYVLELLLSKCVSLFNEFHLVIFEKLESLDICFNIKCFSSNCFIVFRFFLSFANIFFILI